MLASGFTQDAGALGDARRSKNWGIVGGGELGHCERRAARGSQRRAFHQLESLSVPFDTGCPSGECGPPWARANISWWAELILTLHTTPIGRQKMGGV